MVPPPICVHLRSSVVQFFFVVCALSRFRVLPGPAVVLHCHLDDTSQEWFRAGGGGGTRNRSLWGAARGRERGPGVRKVHRHAPDVPQSAADRGTEVIERHLSAYGVTRARDLPEEGKVFLQRELSKFFAAELPDGVPPSPNDRGWRRWWSMLAGRFRRR